MSSTRTNRKQQKPDETEEVQQDVVQDENESTTPSSSVPVEEQEPVQKDQEVPRKPRRSRKRPRVLSQEDVEALTQEIENQVQENKHESEEHLNRQQRTLEIVWPVRPDEDAEHTRWDNLEKKYREYVVPINLIIEKDGLMDFVAPPRHLFIWCAAPKL